MPRAKERKQKPKGAPPSVVPVLQKFLKTYQKHCVQSRTSLCPAIQRDLKSSIDREQILRKFVLVRAGDSTTSTLPVSLEPLLMTIRDESYTQAKEICIWGLHLTNPEIARLALFLESKGHTICPITTLEIINCKMDLWSLGRLGKALQFSSLHFLVLDYCKFGNEELESIFSSLENNQRLQGLSLRYCGLGPQSGPKLGSVISQSAICELHVDGNHLQCSGTLALLRPIAEYAEMQGKDQPTSASPHTGNPPLLPQVCRGGSSALSQIPISSEAVTTRRPSQRKRGKRGIRKKAKRLMEAGPWVVSLHLADNSIDGTGKEGEQLLELTRILTCLIKYSTHLRELDLGNNVLGEMAAVGILEALRARKTGKLPPLKITVTPRISSDTFTSIWKHSKKSNRTRKKKKKWRNEGMG
ncbi:Gm28729 [Phodopus roborovskii]|uniref:Gm28729 protein n=1 Tax=Phodopus roborovskii TaxID=109678 RepID=A0AAU9YT67_PHORO|nr:Gm28729 [Phodopus roborovskii]